MGPTRTLRPSRRSRSKDARVRIRSIKRRGGRGPCRAVTSTRRGRRGCSCEHESRASSSDGVGWAERCASRSSPRIRHCRNRPTIRLARPSRATSGRCSSSWAQPTLIIMRTDERCRLRLWADTPNSRVVHRWDWRHSVWTNHIDVSYPQVNRGCITPGYRLFFGVFSPRFRLVHNVLGSVARVGSRDVHTLWKKLWNDQGMM